MYLNSTLFAQIAVFIVLALFTMKFVWPPIAKVLDERAAKIAEGLAAAEQSRNALKSAEKRSAETVRAGQEKVTELLLQAENQSQRIIEAAKAQAQAEAEKIILGARAEIEQEALRAREALRERVADLAVAGAEKILRREINAGIHADLLAQIRRDF